VVGDAVAQTCALCGVQVGLGADGQRAGDLDDAAEQRLDGGGQLDDCARRVADDLFGEGRVQKAEAEHERLLTVVGRLVAIGSFVQDMLVLLELPVGLQALKARHVVVQRDGEETL